MYQELAPVRPPAPPEPGPPRSRSGPGRAAVGHGRGAIRAVEPYLDPPATPPRPLPPPASGLTVEISARGLRTRLTFADVGADTLERLLALLEAEFGIGSVADPGDRGGRRRGSPGGGWNSLTPAELDVVALVAEGLSNAQIGRRLFIAPATAKSHLHHVFGKLGVANRTQLAAVAIERRAARPN